MMSLAQETASAGGVTAVVEVGTIANCACKKISMTSKADLKRYRKLQDLGCICCYILGLPGVPGDIHHVVENGYRRLSGGNKSTLCLCPFHHRGVGNGNSFFGPSLADGSKPFHRYWGTQGELLAKVNELLREIA